MGQPGQGKWISREGEIKRVDNLFFPINFVVYGRQNIFGIQNWGRRRTLYMDGKMGYNIQEGMSSAEAESSAALRTWYKNTILHEKLRERKIWQM